MGDKINVAIVGVGNCASSLVQGIQYYQNASDGESIPGLMHPRLGPYHIADINFVARLTLAQRRWAKTSLRQSSLNQTTPLSSRTFRTQA